MTTHSDPTESAPVRPECPEEWLDRVDAAGRVIGRLPRGVFHGNPSLRHRAVHIHVIDREGRLLLQQRAWSKPIQPGRWDTAVGGHVASGESRETAARREMHEEIGLRDLPLEHLYDYLWQSPVETELVRTYLVRSDGPFRPHPTEVIRLDWFELDEGGIAGTPVDSTPNLLEELRRLRGSCPELFRRDG